MIKIIGRFIMFVHWLEILKITSLLLSRLYTILNTYKNIFKSSVFPKAGKEFKQNGTKEKIRGLFC